MPIRADGGEFFPSDMPLHFVWVLSGKVKIQSVY